jgi:RNA polymerase sigma-70 factor (ECF subfamily)
MDAPQAGPTDAVLVARLIEGDSEGLDILVARYSGALGGVLRRALGSGAEWEDAAQETWMRVIRFAPRYDPTYPFSRWLFRIAWNVAMDRLGRRRPEVLHPEDHQPADEAPHAEAGLLMRERETAVQDGIAGLPRALAEAVLLRYFDELTEREMAERLGIRPGTVKSRLHHARRRLALLLGDLA